MIRLQFENDMIKIYCIGLALFGTCVLRSQTVVRTTLDECYRWARENYPQVRQYDLIRQTESYDLSHLSKGYLPQLAFDLKATYQNEVTKIPLSLPGIDIPTLRKDQYRAVAEVNQVVWDGGAIRNRKEIVRAKACADARQLESELYTLNDRVNQLYFGILLYDEWLEQNATLQNDLQTDIDKITSMMKNGVANRSDLESITVEWLNARQKEVELQAGRQAYRSMLAALTGKEIGCSTVLQLPEEGKEPSGRISRPELQYYRAQEIWLDRKDRQLTAGLMPQIGLFVQAGYGRPGLNMLENDFSFFYVGGIRFSWNLGHWYTLKNDRRRLATDRRAVDVQRATFLFNTRLQQTQENSEIRKMNRLLATDREIVALRANIRRSAEAKLENGVYSVTDLIREIHAEDRARQAYAAHRIQRLQAIYTYKYITNDNL